jgi:hypothetical protein
MRNPPDKFTKGPKPAVTKLNGIIESIRQNKVQAGPGIRLRETREGVHVSVDPKILVAAGLANSDLFAGKDGDNPSGAGGDSGVRGYRPNPRRRPEPPISNPSRPVNPPSNPPSNPDPPYWGGLDPAPDYPTLRWTTFALPDAELLASYSATLSAVGGNGVYEYELTGGSLPSGLYLVAETIVGTPTSIGSYNFQLTVSSGGLSKAASFTLMVSATGAVRIVGGEYIGAIYWLEPATRSITLSVVGGTPPYSIMFLNGPLSAWYNATYSSGNVPRPPSMGFFPASSIYGEGVTVTIGPNSSAAVSLRSPNWPSETRRLAYSPQGFRRWTMVVFDAAGASFTKTVVAEFLWRSSKYAPAASGPGGSLIYPRWVDLDSEGNLPEAYTPFTGELPFTS